MNEVSPGVIMLPSESAQGVENPVLESSQISHSGPSFIGRGMELLWNMRGIGWKFGTGTGVYVAKDSRDLSNRSIFLRQTLLSIMYHFLVADVSNSILVHSGVRLPGGTLFGLGRNRSESVLISTFLSVTASFYLSYSEFNSLLLKCGR